MLTTEQIQNFERDGFLVPEDLVDSEWLADIKGECAGQPDNLCQQWVSAGLLPAEVVGKTFSEQILATVRGGEPDSSRKGADGCGSLDAVVAPGSYRFTHTGHAPDVPSLECKTPRLCLTEPESRIVAEQKYVQGQ